MFNKEMSFVGVIVFACLIMINEVSASETTTGVSKAEFKKTVGMTKQEVKNKFGSPDTARDGFWIYFDLYDTFWNRWVWSGPRGRSRAITLMWECA